MKRKATVADDVLLSWFLYHVSGIQPSPEDYARYVAEFAKFPKMELQQLLYNQYERFAETYGAPT